MNGKTGRSKILFVRLDESMFDPSISGIIPKSFARAHKVLPLFRVFDVLTVAVDDIPDASVIRELEKISGCGIETVLAGKNAIMAVMDANYGACRRT